MKLSINVKKDLCYSCGKIREAGFAEIDHSKKDEPRENTQYIRICSFCIAEMYVKMVNDGFIKEGIPKVTAVYDTTDEEYEKGS